MEAREGDFGLRPNVGGHESSSGKRNTRRVNSVKDYPDSIGELGQWIQIWIENSSLDVEYGVFLCQ